MTTHPDLDRLQTSYRPFHDDIDSEEHNSEDSPSSSRSPWSPTNNMVHNHGDMNEGPDDLIIHTVPESNKSRWSHIDDLDSFFKKVYAYHRKHGFRVMMLQEIFGLFQFAFIVFISTYTFECVDYDVLFGNSNLKSSKTTSNNKNSFLDNGKKVTISDCVIPIGQCMAGFSMYTWIALLIATVFLCTRLLATFYHFFQYWDIKSFYNIALKISDSELDSISWHEIQKRIVAAQKEYFMCIHKENLTELDIYHRILRFKNYMVAMVNKDLLPVKIIVPFVGEKIFLSHGLKFNLEFLFFKGPWAPFNQWHLKEDFKKVSKKKELADYLRSKIAMLALLNLVLMPFILFWQLLYCFFSYGEQMRREPGSLGVRKWSHYARVYLRHFNELDHELKGRLNRAYKPANKYMELFVSPMTVAVAQNIAFMAGSVFAILLALSLWDEDVLAVEHVLTLISVLGAIVAVCRVFIPDDNMVFCPENTLTAVLAHIHYFPDSWKGQAHTYKVMSEVGELFPYTAMYLVQEIVSPVLTPFVLFFCLRPKASAIVDFFRNFTVEVIGVGDVCSFAQMDIRRHGNPMWHDTINDSNPNPIPAPKTNNYTQAEDGKTEMSLVHFTLTNPDWKPPNESESFIAALKDHAVKETEALMLPMLAEEEIVNSENNAIFNSLNSLEAAGGVHASLVGNVINEMQVQHQQQIQNLNSSIPQQQTSNNTSLMGSVYQSLAGRNNSMLYSNFHNNEQPGGSLMASRLIGLNCTQQNQPNLRQDLRRFGLEYTEADMSFSALYLHELHHRASANYVSRRSAIQNSSRYEFQNQQRRVSLNELDEENVPLVEPSSSRLASSLRP